MRSVPTFTASIYVGTRIHHEPTSQPIEWGLRWLHDYCNRVGLCVTVTPTEYVYTGPGGKGATEDGGEPGFIVGLINYPVFPAEPEAIRIHAMTIAQGLLEVYKQFRISVVFPDETVLVGQDDPGLTVGKKA